MVILLIILYFALGIAIVCAYCAFHGTPTPPDMSEEDKNTFALIVTFWAIFLPVKFVRRLYKAIRALLVKDKNDD